MGSKARTVGSNRAGTGKFIRRREMVRRHEVLRIERKNKAARDATAQTGSTPPQGPPSGG